MPGAVCAIVVNWRKAQATIACVESLLAGSRPPAAVVVVDNGSADGSVEAVRAHFHRDGRVSLVALAENRGFGGGVNAALAQPQLALATLDYVFLVNNDATVASHALDEMVRVAVSRDWGVTGARVMYDHDRTTIWQSCGWFGRLKAGVVAPEKGRKIERAPGMRRRVTYVCGCAMLIRADVLKSIGALDELFFLYEEDTDFSLRATAAGFRLGCALNARVFHQIRDVAQDRTSPAVIFHAARSKVLLLRKHFGSLYFAYGLALHVFLYGPYRMWQISRGSRSLSAACAGFGGTGAALTMRCPVTPPHR